MASVTAAPPRRTPTAAKLAAFVVVIAAVAATLLVARSAVEPRYRVFQSEPLEGSDVAIRTRYPSGWTATGIYPGTDGLESRSGGRIVLVPTAPKGFQAWIESAINHTPAGDWKNTSILIQLEGPAIPANIDRAELRIKQAFSQLGQQGVTVSIHRDRCRAGQLLICETDSPQSPVIPIRIIVLLFPPRQPGQPQHEVTALVSTTRSLKRRMEATALDVVSRMTVVRDASPAERVTQ